MRHLFDVGSVRVFKDGSHYTIQLKTQFSHITRPFDIHHTQVSVLRRALDKLDNDKTNGKA